MRRSIALALGLTSKSTATSADNSNANFFFIFASGSPIAPSAVGFIFSVSLFPLYRRTHGTWRALIAIHNRPVTALRSCTTDSLHHEIREARQFAPIIAA